MFVYSLNALSLALNLYASFRSSYSSNNFFMSKLDSYQLMHRTVGEVAAGIAALVLKNNLQAVIDDKMKHGMLNYGKKLIDDKMKYGMLNYAKKLIDDKMKYGMLNYGKKFIDDEMKHGILNLVRNSSMTR